MQTRKQHSSLESRVKGKPLNVLAVVRWPVGGIRTYLKYVYSLLDPSRYIITILVPKLPETETLKQLLTGSNISYVEVNRNNNLAFLFTVMRVLLRGKFSIVHSHGFTAGLAVALFRGFKRIHHILTPHEILTEAQFHGPFGALKKIYVQLLVPTIDVIQTVSIDAEKNIQSFIPRLKNGRSILITIHNGIPVERFRTAETRDLRKELNLSNKHYLIGFLGRFMEPKGFRVLIDALGILDRDQSLNLIPTVIAVGTGGYVREDKMLVNSLNLSHHFHFLPFVDDVASTIKGLDLIAIPSLWETCPLLPMEAMVAGVPVVGTDCVGLREVLANSPARVVHAGDSAELASAIKCYIASPGKQEAIRFAGEAAIRFNVSNTAEKLCKMFDAVADAGETAITYGHLE